MSPDEYLDAIAREADALTVAAARAAPDATVPSCPKWNVSDLLEHVGRVHRWAAANASRPPDAEPWWSRDVDVGLPLDHGERVEWVRAGARELVRALDRPPASPAWSFMPPATVGFWQRRQAHETAVHRWDAQLVAGAPDPIDATLAVDGIDEVLSMIPVRPGATPPTGNGESIRLSCTSDDAEWVVQLTPDGMKVDRGPRTADVTARGAASDLLLVLWGRIAADAVEVRGDKLLLAGFQDRVRI